MTRPAMLAVAAAIVLAAAWAGRPRQRPPPVQTVKHCLTPPGLVPQFVPCSRLYPEERT